MQTNQHLCIDLTTQHKSLCPELLYAMTPICITQASNAERITHPHMRISSSCRCENRSWAFHVAGILPWAV